MQVLGCHLKGLVSTVSLSRQDQNLCTDDLFLVCFELKVHESQRGLIVTLLISHIDFLFFI